MKVTFTAVIDVDDRVSEDVAKRQAKDFNILINQLEDLAWYMGYRPVKINWTAEKED